ncbi:MAG: 23S rRNA (adenine(2503)-C(2))-methyltransferase RlmN, partial [Dehalococcoidia bacterium]
MRPLLDLSYEELQDELTSWGEPRYRARQVAEWALRRGVTDFGAMTNLPPALRTRLAEAFTL